MWVFCLILEAFLDVVRKLTILKTLGDKVRMTSRLPRGLALPGEAKISGGGSTLRYLATGAQAYSSVNTHHNIGVQSMLQHYAIEYLQLKVCNLLR